MDLAGELDGCRVRENRELVSSLRFRRDGAAVVPSSAEISDSRGEFEIPIQIGE